MLTLNIYSTKISGPIGLRFWPIPMLQKDVVHHAPQSPHACCGLEPGSVQIWFHPGKGAMKSSLIWENLRINIGKFPFTMMSNLWLVMCCGMLWLVYIGYYPDQLQWWWVTGLSYILDLSLFVGSFSWGFPLHGLCDDNHQDIKKGPMMINQRFLQTTGMT